MAVANDPDREVSSALLAATELETAGRPLDAIDALTSANRRAPDARIEQRLVTLRHTAFDAIDHTPPRPTRPPVTATPITAPARALAPADLTIESLSSGLAQHGYVPVRGLIPRERAQRLAAGVDSVLDAFDAHADGARDTAPWYVPFTPTEGRYRVGGRRNWVRASGAVWTVESPRMLFELFEVLADTGVGALVTEYLGERPALSANKCTLRRVPVDTSTNWHQDGAFLGTEVRSINLWLVLSDCGTDAPGLEILPRRLDTVLPTGTDGAIFDWSVSPDVVRAAEHGTPVIAPEFRAGDALLFDHLLLHRTGAGPAMTRERYAMETWMFAPSTYPDGQIPIQY
jgi:hypothetical protein